MDQRTSRKQKRFLLLCLLAIGLGTCPSVTRAQENDPLRVGNYDFAGTTSFGYRFLELNGNQGKYNEVLNLQEGFRLFDTQLNFQAREPNQSWFDRFSVSTQNLGGDPFPGIQLQLRKHGLYELRAGYRATQYFINLPETRTSLNRQWIDRRRFGDLSFRYTPNPNLRFHFFYNRTERDGSQFTTGPFFFLPIGPDVWSAFGRANQVPLVIPLREEANLFGGGVDYRLGETNLHLEQSYRTYNNPASQREFPDQAIQLLGTGPVRRWDEFASLDIRTTTVRVDREMTGRLLLRAGYIYTQADGPIRLDASVLLPSAETVDFSGTGTTDLTTHTAEAGLTLQLFETIDLVSDYRYQTFGQKGAQSLQAVRSDVPDPFELSQNDSLRWDFGMHTVDTLVALVPHATFNLRGGVRFFKQNIVRKIDDRIERGTRRSKSYTPVFNFSWRPSRKFALRGHLEQRTLVDPYVRLAPEKTFGTKFRARYNPSERWSIQNSWVFRNWSTDAIGLLIHSRSNSTTLRYQPNARLMLHAGFTYSSFYSENSIAFERGVPPLTGLLSTDQTIDRIYSWGLKASPKDNLTLSFTGQFIRSGGSGTIANERGTFGSLTWPAWTAELGYSLPQVGRVVFGWQRSYYYEDLFRLTDYSANGFTVRFERSF